MNRRMGGGPRGPNRSSFSQQPFQQGGGGGLNPWQGGGGNVNQGGILSQITSNPQLALALSSLLQPQQQQPPSLLSLNTAPSYINRDFGGGGRFGSRGGRDFRRHEPYNKNRGGYGGGGQRRRSPKRKNDDNKKNTKKEKKEEDAGEDDEKKETKRDWKDEKNTEAKDDDEETDQKDGEKDGKYGGVPRKYLNCFVCNKQMWDGESMSKHVRGRAHHEMLKALEESIHICVNILRENLRLAEERKMIEFNRQSRMKQFHRREPPLSHCAMCDLKFMGKIISHRRTDGHQRLKRYLHPNCRSCNKEYPSRIEWVEHCLTPEHLRRVHENSEKKLTGKDGDVVQEEEAEDKDLDLQLDPLLEENLHMEDEDPILEMDSPLENMAGRLPAYKKDRALAPSSLQEFSGWRCALCHRSFAKKEDSEEHLTTKKHFYNFIDYIKDRFEKEEKKKKAEKEAKKKEEAEAKEAENGEKDGEEEEEGDEEMYDPTEATEEEDKVNGEEGEEEVAEESKMDTSNVEEEVEEEEEQEEEEPKAEVKKEPEAKKEVVVVKEPPATPKPATRRGVAGPKSKRGRK